MLSAVLWSPIADSSSLSSALTGLIVVQVHCASCCYLNQQLNNWHLNRTYSGDVTAVLLIIQIKHFNCQIMYFVDIIKLIWRRRMLAVFSCFWSLSFVPRKRQTKEDLQCVCWLPELLLHSQPHEWASFICLQSISQYTYFQSVSQEMESFQKKKFSPENFNVSIQWVHLRRTKNWWGKLGLPSDAFLKWKPNGKDGRFEIPGSNAFQAKSNKPENGGIYA